MAYAVEPIRAYDRAMKSEQEALLAREGIRLDGHVEYSIGVFDADGRMVATGSAYRSSLRSIAVDSAHQGEGLLALLLTALMERQIACGFSESFLYTKPEAAPQFRALGFHEIERVAGKLVFMTSRRTAFEAYLSSLGGRAPGRSSAIVMNANPFTLGHLHLVRVAARESDALHLFVLSDDVSLVPYDVRMRLVKENTRGIPGVICHPSGDYMVSTATFPSYFLKDEEEVTFAQSELDARVFAQIAAPIGITRRFVGEEPFSGITRIYNEVLKRTLPPLGIELTVIPRADRGGRAISASDVRALIKRGDTAAIRPYVPDATYDYFMSDEARPVVEAIRAADNVVHD